MLHKPEIWFHSNVNIPWQRQKDPQHSFEYKEKYFSTLSAPQIIIYTRMIFRRVCCGCSVMNFSSLFIFLFRFYVKRVLFYRKPLRLQRGNAVRLWSCGKNCILATLALGALSPSSNFQIYNNQEAHRLLLPFESKFNRGT